MVIIILTIIGFFGIPSLYSGVINLFFKYNIEFHKILESFPLISENRINGGAKTIVSDFHNIEVSKELTDFIEHKRGEIDEFLAKLEKFDNSKLIFKKKEITYFIDNTKRLLTQKANKIKLSLILNPNTNEITRELENKPFDWYAFNYIMVDETMKNKKEVDKLFISKFLKF